MANGSHFHGSRNAREMAESRLPGKACSLRHHGRNTSRGYHHTPLGYSERSFVNGTIFQVACLEPLLDELPSRNVTQGSQQEIVVDVVIGCLDVRIDDPLLPLVRASQQ